MTTRAWSTRFVPAAAALGLLSLHAACGTPSHPALATNEEPLPEDAGIDVASLQGTGKPPGCGVGPEGGVCACEDLPLLTDPPNLYFIIDRSGSMLTDNKFATILYSLDRVMAQIGPRARFGAALFPDPNAGDCSPGKEVAAMRLGDAPAGSAGPNEKSLTGAINVSPGGGTPTAATLRALLPGLKALGKNTFVILATDGGPNCNAEQSCGLDRCIPNIEGSESCFTDYGPNCCDPSLAGGEACIDDAPTIQAVIALHGAGIQTYVVGVPGSGPYAALLDRLADAGGTARATSPFYYRVDTSDSAAFVTALKQVAAHIVATCTFVLKGDPPAPRFVNVYLDEALLPRDPIDGWKIEGNTVTLVGAACDNVNSGAVLDVRVIAGCPTVEK